LQKFVKLNIKGNTGLYCRKSKNDISLISNIDSKKEIEAFRDKYIIFKLPVDEGVKIVNISEVEAKNDFLLPKLIKTIFKK
jgi:hypothetical protein